MEKPVLDKIVYRFYQDGNTDGTTDEYEELEITVEGIDIEKEGGYLVLRTSTGWSINDNEELSSLINKVKKGIYLKNI